MRYDMTQYFTYFDQGWFANGMENALAKQGVDRTTMIAFTM